MKLNEVLTEWNFGFNRDTTAMIEALGDNPKILDEIFLMSNWHDVRDYLKTNFDFKYYGINPGNVDWYEVATAMNDDFKDDTEEQIKVADSDMDQF